MPLKAFYLGSSHSSSLAFHGKALLASLPGASSSPVSLASQTAPGMVGFLACLGAPDPREPPAAPPGSSAYNILVILDYQLQNCGPVTSRKIEAGENRDCSLASDHSSYHIPEGTIGRTSYHDGNLRWKPGVFSVFSHQSTRKQVVPFWCFLLISTRKQVVPFWRFLLISTRKQFRHRSSSPHRAAQIVPRVTSSVTFSLNYRVWNWLPLRRIFQSTLTIWRD
ncbi:hypothetical protein E5288_WYG012154 [Bos mutus]|uniref:Uncharacterized protein n=1 Tax=Bos mutus TaxID=72004 RepID=A0A6B0R2M6_9CETA|nr:hypothetical protein [Bos mutus]